jgi:alginate O-acetyltransferase complex protein AlgI
LRDYVYIPLGGNRLSLARTHINQMIVFALCGLWHGASLTFLFWGLWHGAFLTLERLGFDKLLNRLGRPLQTIYVWLAFVLGWVLFRADNFAQARAYYRALFGFNSPSLPLPPNMLFDERSLILLLISMIAGTGVVANMYGRIRKSAWAERAGGALVVEWGTALFGAACLLLSVTFLLGQSYNPFIYFRF